ncbi:MAG: hypothetical protein ACI9R3_006179 [Verrucomicrobiales bacterium]
MSEKYSPGENDNVPSTRSGRSAAMVSINADE